MASVGIRTLQITANAAGSAFACLEEDFEPRYVAHPSRAKKVTVLAVLTGFVALVAGHHFGLAKMIAALPGWRVAA